MPIIRIHSYIRPYGVVMNIFYRSLEVVIIANESVEVIRLPESPITFQYFIRLLRGK